MNKHDLRARFHRLFHSTWFSLLFLLVLVAGLATLAYYVTKSFQKEPDFGGMVTIRQADMEIDNVLPDGNLRLSRSMVLDYITNKDVLVPIARRYGWEVPYEEMVRAIDVKERLSAQNSYIIIANTRSMARSARVARALTLSFLDDYRKKWEVQSRKILAICAEKIAGYEKELVRLKKLKQRFQDKNELRPLNTEIEMKALNEQLVKAQSQFLTAYGAYVSRMEEKRSALQLELDMARQVYTDSDIEIRNMKRKLAELDRQCEQIREQLSRQKPDLYRMNMDPPKLTGLPNDVLYFYENIQTLQQIKLALMLGSIIEDKEKMLERELKKKNTIERLLDSNSCDVFIRGVGQ